MKREILGIAILIALLGLSGGAGAQSGKGSRRSRGDLPTRQEKRKSQALAERIERRLLTNVTFGDNATLTLVEYGAETIVARCPPTAVIHAGTGDATLTTLAQKALNRQVCVELVKSGGEWSVREIWDENNWSLFLLRHQGVKSGRIVQKTSQILRLSDDLRYDLSKSTRWVKGGLEATSDDFNALDTVFVKSKAFSPSGPMALTVADTAEGAESTRADTLKNAGPKVDPRPAPGSPSGDLPTPGSGDLPKPGSSYSGDHRPASTDAAYKISAYLRILDSSDNADETNIIGATGQFAEIYGIRDKKVECFGEMRADGNLIWIIERKDAEKNRRSTGERIVVLPPSSSPYREGGAWVWHGQSVRLSGFLKDDDNLTRDDLLCEWSARLNLEELAGKGEKAFTRVGKARLYVTVTRQ